MTLAETFDKAADFLEQHRWTRGRLAGKPGNGHINYAPSDIKAGRVNADSASYCGLGAICMVVGGDIGSPEFEVACRFANRHVLKHDGVVWLPEFNDHIAKSKKQVVAKLREIAEAARAASR